jgi:hypothetical protein
MIWGFAVQLTLTPWLAISAKVSGDGYVTNKKGAGNRRTVQRESIVNGSELWGWARRGSVPVLREFFRCRSDRLCHPGME